MIDGLDPHKDAIGIISHEEFVCGECQKQMVEVAPNKYRCPKCGAVFEDMKGGKEK